MGEPHAARVAEHALVAAWWLLLALGSDDRQILLGTLYFSASLTWLLSGIPTWPS